MAVDNPQPYEHEMLALGSDRIGVAFHGIAHTHLDSLAHINYDKKVFGNAPRWILPVAVGRAVVSSAVSESDLIEVLRASS